MFLPALGPQQACWGLQPEKASPCPQASLWPHLGQGGPGLQHLRPPLAALAHADTPVSLGSLGDAAACALEPALLIDAGGRNTRRDGVTQRVRTRLEALEAYYEEAGGRFKLTIALEHKNIPSFTCTT